jgi:hypothetical protein
MAEASESPNDDLWQFAEFCMLEAFLLRSFLENLRLRKDSPEEKIALLSDWKQAAGLQLGNSTVCDAATAALKTARDAPPERRRAILQQALASAREQYFFS